MNAWCPSERVATRSAIDEISSKFIGEPRSEVHCSMQSGKLRSKPAEPLSPSTRIIIFRPLVLMKSRTSLTILELIDPQSPRSDGNYE